jgi:hypothetical protein
MQLTLAVCTVPVLASAPPSVTIALTILDQVLSMLSSLPVDVWSRVQFRRSHPSHRSGSQGKMSHTVEEPLAGDDTVPVKVCQRDRGDL